MEGVRVRSEKVGEYYYGMGVNVVVNTIIVVVEVLTSFVSSPDAM